jgi:hypothetical protein
MENHINEPQPPVATPRPCSTPHSAPVEWLKEVTKGHVPEGAFDEGFEWPPEEPDPDEARAERLTEIVELLRSDPRALAHVAASLAPEDGRSDGWTPFARRLFLEVLSETGRVTTACDYARLTKQSAYALRARDPLFAASWDAACEIARAPLADALYERAIEGVTETVTRDGKVVATRHRHDNRLSIAVLHRLDKRCDRAAEAGARHLALVHHWDEWLSLVGKGEEQAAGATLEKLPHGQASQFPLGGNPMELDSEPEEIDLSDRFRETSRDGEKVWMTDLPPPAGFTGYENCDYGDPDEIYERECTPEEAEILEADAARARNAERAEEEELRDTWLALLKAESCHPRESGDPAETKSPAEAGEPLPRLDKTLGSRLRGNDELGETPLNPPSSPPLPLPAEASGP